MADSPRCLRNTPRGQGSGSECSKARRGSSQSLAPRPERVPASLLAYSVGQAVPEPVIRRATRNSGLSLTCQKWG